MEKETLEELFSRQTKELQDLESSDEGASEAQPDTKVELEKKQPEKPETKAVKPEDDTSYDEYEKKTPTSARLNYQESEIEVIEE